MIGVLALAVAAQVSDAEISAGLEWVRSMPPATTEYEYVITGAVRLGLFWLSRDDVGLGRIRMGAQAGAEFIQLVVGAVPEKAPFGLNRWGEAPEILRPADGRSVFFGLMTPTGDSSFVSARDDIQKNRQTGEHKLQVLLSHVDKKRAVSSGRLLTFDKAWTVTQLHELEGAVLGRLADTTHAPRVLQNPADACGSTDGLLYAVRALMDSAAAPPVSRGFVYHSRCYTATLVRAERVAETTIAFQLHGARMKSVRTYRDLRRLEFEILNRSSGRKSTFEMLAGASGVLRGVPIQIEYRPNWWLRLRLSLSSGSGI